MNPQPPASDQPATSTPPARARALRLRPGIALAVLLVLVRFLAPLVIPGGAAIGVLGGLAGALLIAGWWLFFSRAPWIERVGALLLMGLGIAGTSRIVHPSIANGMMGLLLPVFALPAVALALVAWAALTRALRTPLRRVTLVATMLAASGAFALLRTGGITADANSDFHWRWSPTPEEQLLARPGPTQPPAPVREAGSPARPSPTAATPPDSRPSWPGFRGPDRSGVVRGVRLRTDWVASPPNLLWRQPVGPGWSSFAVAGDRFYTQEQRGEEETVACYRLASGDLVWRHGDPVRFWESNAGAGPRGTPTLHGDRLYAMGAKGLLNALDARTGAVLWSRRTTEDTGRKVPEWGFAASPLVLGEFVVTANAGTLGAYDAATGTRRWVGPAGRGGYSSPQAFTLAGVPQVLLLDNAGLTSLALTNGAVLWQHAWPGDGVVQPSVTPEGDLLLGSGSGLGGGRVGVRRISVLHGAGGWSVTERWTSNGLKPYFNDYVTDGRHAWGFDNGLLACLDLADGRRRWKDGRYGGGQVLLLADQSLLLVVSEAGELALVEANAERYREPGRFPAIHGKTWNHPVLAGEVLLVRNAEEMAAYRLAIETR